jgi:hypothetical protein
MLPLRVSKVNEGTFGLLFQAELAWQWNACLVILTSYDFERQTEPGQAAAPLPITDYRLPK